MTGFVVQGHMYIISVIYYNLDWNTRTVYYILSEMFCYYLFTFRYRYAIKISLSQFCHTCELWRKDVKVADCKAK